MVLDLVETKVIADADRIGLVRWLMHGSRDLQHRLGLLLKGVVGRHSANHCCRLCDDAGSVVQVDLLHADPAVGRRRLHES
jgi:hypothetical protein